MRRIWIKEGETWSDKEKKQTDEKGLRATNIYRERQIRERERTNIYRMRER